MAIPIRLGRSREALGHPQIRESQAPGQPLLGGDDEVHDPELQALRLVDGEHVHRGRRLLEVGRRRIVAGLAE